MIHLDTLGTLALRGSDGREVRTVLAQPKRLALLAFLAVESARGFQRRDRLFALFWPDLSQAQARQALRQSLYFLRRSLADHVLLNRGGEEIAIDPEVLRCDARAFIDVLDQNRLEDGLALYRGEFLPGLFVADAAPELEHWIDATRAELRQRAVHAAWQLVDAAEQRGRPAEAEHWGRYALRLAPDDERAVRKLMALLAAQGDRVGALRVYTEFAERLLTEFELEPSTETRAAIDALRHRESPVNAIATTAARAPADRTVSREGAAWGSDSVRLVSVSRATLALSRIRWLRRGLYVAAAAGTAIVAGALSMWGNRRPDRPVVAVGWIQDPSGADTGISVRTLADLLATDLARIPGLRVVSHARLYDLLAQLGARDETPSAISDAARHAGADELLEAVLSRGPSPDRKLRLDLRRVDLATGSSGSAHTFEASTEFELADIATAKIAADFGLRAPANPLAGVTTTSLAAQRLYEEGLSRFYHSQQQSAVELFHAALREDSTFAMAAYYAGLAEKESDGAAARRDLALALRLADRLSERERLMIRQTWAFTANDPAQLAMAESLAVRYPDEPGSELTLGRAMQWSGDFLGALPHLRRAIHLDSLSLTGRSPSCRACDALDLTLSVYLAADSIAAAERTARDWTRMQPKSAAAWWALAWILGREERFDAAVAAEQVAERVASSDYEYLFPRVAIALRSGEFSVADRMLADRAENGNLAKRAEALWWLVISLRDQGRLHEALAAADAFVRTTESQSRSSEMPTSTATVTTAQVLFEMGRYRRAAALFDSLSNDVLRAPDVQRDVPGVVARHRIWMMTQVATVLAAAGDTVRLASIADSMQVWSEHSAFYRDRVLHHYVRGLLFRARGRAVDAEHELEQAYIEPTEGYSRVNLALGQVLIADGRAREAIAVLSAPLHGPIEASNYYLTYTDLHAALGEAFDRANEPDSALAHYRQVLAAWHAADAELRPRLDSILQRVGALTRDHASAAPRHRP
jgi:DNA-binding SARP family transcriptional activator